MTPDEFADKLRRNLRNIEQRDEPLRIASIAAHSDMSNRIFIKGEDSNNAKIGNYSLEGPDYVTPEGYWDFSALKPPKGKYGNQTFKNGKKHKSTYVGHYENLRSKIGRQTDKVDFNIRGDFRSDFIANTEGEQYPEPELRTKNQFEFYSAFSRKKGANKFSGTIVTSTDITHGELAKAFETKYNTKIFILTEEEKEKFYATAEAALFDALTK